MSTEGAYLGVDVGTSSTKAVLVSAGGRLIDSQTVEHTVRRGPDDLVEMDPGIWWDEFRELFTALTGRNTVEVLGIGVSGMGPCVALADQEDRSLAPAALYGVDRRSREEIADMTSALGEDDLLNSRDALLTSQAAGPKMLWFARRLGQKLSSGTRVYMPASWIIRRITGEYVLDRHSASQCTPFYSPEAQDWDQVLADEWIPEIDLPRLGWSGDICGETRATEELPSMPAGIPVICGTIDAWAEQESVGAVGDGELFLMYGTTLFLIANSSERLRHPSMWGTTGTRPGTFNLAGGLASSGALTDWFRDLSGIRDYQQLTQEASEVPPGSHGLLALPYFAGERTPIQDPDARGVFVGLSMEHTRAHVYRALLESTAFAVRHNIEVMEQAGADIASISCAGGGVLSELWPQIISDVTGREQTVRKDTIGAAYGDAFMVARAQDAVSTLDQWNPVVRTISPRKVPVYEDLYSSYRELYEKTAETQHQMAELQRSLPTFGS